MDVRKLFKKAFSFAIRLGVTNVLSDKDFTKILYYLYTGRRLNLNSPDDFNQKIQWLKLNYRNPLVVQGADKYGVRALVSERIGAQYLNRLIGVFSNVEEIDFDKLPERFVMKATHASGWNLVCPDKNKLDVVDAKRKLHKWLTADFSQVGREWQYREICPRIVCEEFMEEADGSPLRDYKLFTFKGETKYVGVEFDKPDGKHYLNIYDAEGVFQPQKRLGDLCDGNYLKELPSCWEQMKELARKLASDFPMCRVDFYVLNGTKIVFGELTFTPGKGCNSFHPQSFCEELGSYIELPRGES